METISVRNIREVADEDAARQRDKLIRLGTR
jgi:hypothetical protein